MTIITKKLLADYESDHIVMVHPYMYKNTNYYNDLVQIYIKLNKIFSANDIRQTIVLDKGTDYSSYYIKSLHNEIIRYNCDDIWIRDYYPKIYFSRGVNKVIKYKFNAYGEKYTYKMDNNFKETLKYPKDNINLNNFVLEGGNLEFSALGAIITNIKCIYKNNKTLGDVDIEYKLKELKDALELNELLTLNIDELLGDDTNGHIDNLVRFIEDDTIAYFASKDKAYCNYPIAKELERQLDKVLSNSEIIKHALPVYHDTSDMFIRGRKVYPYSKLNFIVSSNCFIFPYIRNNKETILSSLESLDLNKKLFLLNTEAALRENGGLHCLTANI